MTELRLHLQMEDFEEMFCDNELKTLRHNTTHLMKVAGKIDTAMDMKKSIL